MNKDDILTILRQQIGGLKEKYGIVRLGLFGSFARNEQIESSDIDLVVEIEQEKKNIHVFFALKRELEALLGKKVDLGIESALKPIAKKSIDRDMIYV